jgi:transposase
MGRRRSFTAEFKREAVKQVRERGIPAAQVARGLGIHENVLRNWVRQMADDPLEAFPGNGKMKPQDAELARLHRELKKVTAERDILKKALGYFAKEPT